MTIIETGFLARNQVAFHNLVLSKKKKIELKSKILSKFNQIISIDHKSNETGNRSDHL